MEIDLDLALIRRIRDEEYARARSEIEALGPVAALASSHARHDARIAGAADVGTLACGVGCTWCCHFTVDVRAVEAFAILAHVQATLPPAQSTRILGEVRENAVMLAGLDEDARVTRNLRCPFLADGACVIYTARPQSCRNYHATDVAGCQASYEDPANLDIDPEFAPLVYQSGGAHVEAFAAALRDAGYDVKAYELNGALAAALENPGAQARFEAGKPPFRSLPGEVVYEEFGDLDDA